MDLPFQTPVTEWDWETIERISDRSEGQYLEYKEKIHADDDEDSDKSPINLEREICAFANASGGVLVFGVNDDGDLYPFASPDHAVEQSVPRLLQNTTPVIPIETSSRIEAPSDSVDRILFAVKIDEATRKPIRCSDGSIYVRVNDRKEPMSREQMESLFIESDRKQQTIRQLELEINRFGDAVTQTKPDITSVHPHSPPDFHLLNTEGIREVLRDADHLYGDEEVRETISRVLTRIREIEHQEVMFGRAMNGVTQEHSGSQKDFYQNERQEFKKKMKRLGRSLEELADLADLDVSVPDVD